MLPPPRFAICALAFALLLPSAAARADETCANEPGEEAMAAIDQAVLADDDDKSDQAWTTQAVKVYVHVIYDETTGAGKVDAATAKRLTLDVVNERFAAQAIPFVFELESIDYTPAPTSVYQLQQYGDDEKALYDMLNVDGRRALNLYIVGPRPGTSVTGWAEFLVNPAMRRGDHVVLRYFPNRGGFSDPWVVVHEVGHWMGLLHTFHFGCGGLAHGDLIWDTPTQADGHNSCALESDTCDDDDGLDPIDNIMGYSYGCRGVFSDKQIRRMKFLWRTARGGKSDEEVTVDAPTEAAGGCATGGGGLGLGAIALIGLALSRRRRRG